MSFRNKTWQDIAALDEHLTVFLKLDEALERFLEDFRFSSHEAYKIGTDSGLVDRSSRALISAAVDSLGGSLSSLEVRYNAGQADDDCPALCAGERNQWCPEILGAYLHRSAVEPPILSRQLAALRPLGRPGPQGRCPPCEPSRLP
jgi:hypothetical protein